MNKNNYAVTVKFGHVGRNNYIVKTIPVKASNGKEAANIARWSARVKHHAKDAIIDVKKISNNEYEVLKTIKENDPYFHCSNIQQQREACADIEENIIRCDDVIDDFEERVQRRKERIMFNKKKNKVCFKEYIYATRNYAEQLAY